MKCFWCYEVFIKILFTWKFLNKCFKIFIKYSKHIFRYFEVFSRTYQILKCFQERIKSKVFWSIWNFYLKILISFLHSDPFPNTFLSPNWGYFYFFIFIKSIKIRKKLNKYAFEHLKIHELNTLKALTTKTLF